jgi:molecular chaperone GrpE
MVATMSGDSNAPAEGEGDVLPVEVEAPGEAAAVPAGPAATEVELLELKLAMLEKDKKDTYDRYLRAVADLDNLRKRQKREVEDARLEMKQKVLKEMLPVVDNLERAIEHAGSAEQNPIVDGVRLVLRQFTTAFERLDVTLVEAEGQPFDPNVHEAISQLESDKPPGTVIQVLQRGYKSGDRLLRPALVVVAKAKAE